MNEREEFAVIDSAVLFARCRSSNWTQFLHYLDEGLDDFMAMEDPLMGLDEHLAGQVPAFI